MDYFRNNILVIIYFVKVVIFRENTRNSAGF
jgi:hypothetical protein